jgi:2-methylisocitrate lyase-like PEP mutase family enzyme
MLFVEAPNDEQAKAIPSVLPGCHIINLVESKLGVQSSADEMKAAGYRVAIYPITPLLLAAKAMRDGLAVLRTEESSKPLESQMMTFDEFMTFMGMTASLEKDRLYQSRASALVRASGTR